MTISCFPFHNRVTLHLIWGFSCMVHTLKDCRTFTLISSLVWPPSHDICPLVSVYWQNCSRAAPSFKITLLERAANLKYHWSLDTGTTWRSGPHDCLLSLWSPLFIKESHISTVFELIGTIDHLSDDPQLMLLYRPTPIIIDLF